MTDTPAMTSEHFINRELSLLAFNRRVLAQAADERTPLLERLRFICIVSSNLDEFFEIRVAGLKEQLKLGGNAAGPDGVGPKELMNRVSREAHALVEDQYNLLNNEILPELRAEGIVMEAIRQAGDGRVLELPMGMPFRPTMVKAGADYLWFVITPRSKDWTIGGIRKAEHGFELRADLPVSWAGLTGEVLISTQN